MAGRLRLKSIFTLIFILLVGFLVSCTAPGGTQTGPEPSNLGTAFVGGDNGLVISFIPGLPPDQIVDSSVSETQGRFKVGVQVENVGENDLVFGEDALLVTIEGINPVAFGIASVAFTQPFTNTIRGKEKLADTVFPGDRARFVFPSERSALNFLNYMGTLPGSQTFTIQANACYTYETLAATKLCMTDEFFRRATPGQTKVCESGVKVVENWGAPVKVTRLEQTPIRFTREGVPEALSIVFDIEQRGGGQVFDAHLFGTPELASCIRIPIGAENIVAITLAKSDGSFNDIRCFPDEVRLVNGRATVTCDVLLDPNLPRIIEAEDTLVLKLTYGHLVSTQTQLAIHPDRSNLLQ